MKPTCQFRYVRREIVEPLNSLYGFRTSQLLLQQWWEETVGTVTTDRTDLPMGPRGEWRDVPIEEEK